MSGRTTFLTAAAATLSLAAWLAGADTLQAYHGPAGYYRGGPYHGYGGYRPYGYYPYAYRPYPVVGIGIGVYAPYYGTYTYPLAPPVVYAPYSAPVVVNSSPGDQTPEPPPSKPAPDNAGHLQLLVPADAEVLVDGARVPQTGTTREIVSPAVTPGTRYTYKIGVRYTDPQGKPVNDTRDITFQANDWFTIDFTRPAPAQAAPAPQLEVHPLPFPMKLR